MEIVTRKRKANGERGKRRAKPSKKKKKSKKQTKKRSTSKKVKKEKEEEVKMEKISTRKKVKKKRSSGRKPKKEKSEKKEEKEEQIKHEANDSPQISDRTMRRLRRNEKREESPPTTAKKPTKEQQAKKPPTSKHGTTSEGSEKGGNKRGGLKGGGQSKQSIDKDLIWTCSKKYKIAPKAKKTFTPKYPLDPRLQKTKEGKAYAKAQANHSIWDANLRATAPHRCAFCGTTFSKRRSVSDHEPICKKGRLWNEQMLRQFFSYHRPCGKLKLKFRYRNEQHKTCPHHSDDVKKSNRELGDKFLGKGWFTNVKRWKTEAGQMGRFVGHGNDGWETSEEDLQTRLEKSQARSAKYDQKKKAGGKTGGRRRRR